MKVVHIILFSILNWMMPIPVVADISPQPPHTLTIMTSLSCPACKKFFEKTFPEIEGYAKEKGIQIIFFPFATDGRTLAATALTYSLSPERQHELYLEFLSTQDKWHVQGDEGLNALRKIAINLGIPDSIVDRAMNDDEDPLKNAVLERIRDMAIRHKIKFVPAILVDDRVIVDASLDAVKTAVEQFTAPASAPAVPAA